MGPPIVSHFQELMRHFAVYTEEQARAVFVLASEKLADTPHRPQWDPCSAWACQLCKSMNDEEDEFCMCCLCDKGMVQEDQNSRSLDTSAGSSREEGDRRGPTEPEI